MDLFRFHTKLKDFYAWVSAVIIINNSMHLIIYLFYMLILHTNKNKLNKMKKNKNIRQSKFVSVYQLRLKVA